MCEAYNSINYALSFTLQHSADLIYHVHKYNYTYA